MGAGCFKSKPTICWNCANACGGCCWSKSFKPVDGWTATPTKVYQVKDCYIDSYVVYKCPQFKKQRSWIVSEMSIYELAELLECSLRTVYRLTNAEIVQMCKQKGVILEIYQKNKKRKFLVDNRKAIHIPPKEVLELFFGKQKGYTGF